MKPQAVSEGSALSTGPSLPCSLSVLASRPPPNSQHSSDEADYAQCEIEEFAVHFDKIAQKYHSYSRTVPRASQFSASPPSRNGLSTYLKTMSENEYDLNSLTYRELAPPPLNEHLPALPGTNEISVFSSYLGHDDDNSSDSGSLGLSETDDNNYSQIPETSQQRHLVEEEKRQRYEIDIFQRDRGASAGAGCSSPWLHRQIFKRNFKEIHSFLNSNAISEIAINQLDCRGNTPFMLLLKVSEQELDRAKEPHRHSIQEYIHLAQQLIDHGADITRRDGNGWSCFDEAVSQGNIEYSVFLFEQLRRLKMQRWSLHRSTMVAKLKKIPDFFVEIRWNCKSLIPLVSKFAPSDTFKIWKIGASVRLDFTCVGWKSGSTKRRDMTVLFMPPRTDSRFEDCDMLLLNRSKKTVVNLLEELDQEEKVAILHDLINSDPVKGEFKIVDHKVNAAKTVLGKPKRRKINDWMCQKFWLKFSTHMTSETKSSEEKMAMAEDEYFSNTSLPPRESPVAKGKGGGKKKQKSPHKDLKKSLTCAVWTSEQFPIQFENLITVVQSISDGNSYLTKLEDFLKEKAVSELLMKTGFPVKIQVPIKYSIRAVFRFQKFVLLEASKQPPPPRDLFAVPASFDFISRKEGSKILQQKNKKKRLVLAMAQIRV